MLVERITFKHGPKPEALPLEIIPGRVTVFVGPNNGGKSSALRDITNEFIFNHARDQHVISAVKIANVTRELAEQKISKFRVPEAGETPERRIFIRRNMGRQEVNEQYLLDHLLKQFNQSPRDPSLNMQYISQHLLSMFALNLTGENRLGLVTQSQAQRLTDPAQTTIAALFQDDALRHALSDIIFDSFHMHLVIDATNMGAFSYALSETRPPAEIERAFTAEAIEFFRNTHALSASSDGTKAFVGVLSEVIAGEVEVLIIDEPEAFLHPGLAYTLGRQIGLKIGADKQLFAATHSPHFLMGCLSAGVPIDVVRLTHRAGRGTAQLLPATRLSQMMNDPLLRSVGVVSALFYESAVVVEADADRAFYEEINNRLSLYSPPNVRHATFLNAHNKQTASEIVAELRQVGVPSALVVDIDWIKEDGQVCTKYFDAAGIPEGLRQGLRNTRQTVRGYLNAANPDYKRQGGIALLAGDELATAVAFFNQMETYGLFTVRSGELESWLPHLDCNRNKSVWLSEVFAALGSDPSLPAYVRPAQDDVWKFLRDIATWVSNPNLSRQGSLKE
ncbi:MULTISPECIES: ATP-dependent nuclease [unclassified Mesorhizobium]|uniref:ATP-dependent nuclease n=1 Tax=unclassified Mesorhizobium TaxID=325217 RepID=UPI001CCBC35D|nr:MULTISPECIES: ATP-binding protein [unclassified Mesorhizobium]MBZ9916867.1 AAA family ATPase [Mesorhizobium sp. BR1-1-7]MBZ9954554.1 AAA family ATPase [Mesorhizobium sp. BR1-1-15]MBZ9971482.1 AAA family ATPase [Mesorhizobium sp. BR1-1-12]